LERSPMLMVWWNQHSKNGFTNKNNLHVQWNSHQNPYNTHHIDWKIFPKVHLETQKTVNIQDNTEQKEQCWRYHNTQPQTILQSHSNKNSMVLAQKKIWRPVEQSRGTRYESTQLLRPYFLTKASKTYNEEKTSSSTNVAGEVVICLQKTETRSMPITLY
jgi:hypothetical protein